MDLYPYGNLNEGFKDAFDQDAYSFRDPYRKIDTFRESASVYEMIVKDWMQEMRDFVWPEYTGKQRWVGDAAKHAHDATECEIKICKEQFQDKGILRQIVDIHGKYPDTEHRDHLWHYCVEDAHKFSSREAGDFDYHASKGQGANFLGYSTDISERDFQKEFWYEHRRRQAAFLAIKLLFQRPRPWMVARYFGMPDFEWHAGSPRTHTGLHPAFPSGHCYQGLIHSANILQNWQRRSANGAAQKSGKTFLALRQYAVDLGDRRVFAGVHFPTDNISSWIFALNVAPYMFDNAPEIVAFIKEAVTNHSKVYKVIIEEFPKHKSLHPALNLMLKYFPSS